MDWLKDKKNRPVIALVGAIIAVLISVALWFFVFSGGEETTMEMTDSSVQPPVSPTPGAPPATPGVPSTPGAPPATPTPAAMPAVSNTPTGGEARVAAMPMEEWRADPFLPLNYKPQPKPVKHVPKIHDLPLGALFHLKAREEKVTVDPAEPAQPPRRMAGILLNNRIYAIIETNGKSEVVQPGSMLSDRLAVVEKIERDKVVLKTVSKKPTYIVVRMAAAPRSSSAGDGGGTYTPSPSAGGGISVPSTPSMPM